MIFRWLTGKLFDKREKTIASFYNKRKSISAKGGIRTDNTDHTAPKVIASAEIVSFDCAFSTLYKLTPCKLDKRFYSFEATIQNGKATGKYLSEKPSSPDKTVNGSFEADADFLAMLQNIVANHDLAKYNGLSRRVSGLPPKLGAKLYITYASGETISASNNQTNFLSPEEMQTIERLFRQAAFGESQIC